MLRLLFVLQSAVPGDSARVYNGLAHQLNVAVPRIEATVKVDGVLDEPVWRRAAVLTGFSQYRPVDGRPAADTTQVLVWYSGDAIYFGIRAFEAHGAVVRATLADRDNIDTDDRVLLLLDTFADHRRALIFAVNPLGVQEDGIWSDAFEAAAGGPQAGGRFDATIDLNPDFVYESHGRVTGDGYEVEIRIPFKSLRYQSTDPQDWGFQVVRETQHTGYEDTWAPTVRASASFLIQSGKLTGLTGLHRGLVMDATPEFTTKVNGAPSPPSYVYKGEPDVGGTLRWGVTENLTLNGTAHPDFSQVEADVGQVTANVRFPLFFPEKRPFFLEGLEQYDTPNLLIYTRRVVEPVAGAKLTGKVGGTNVAYLGAVDDPSQSPTGNHPIYDILRVRRDLGMSSTAGFAYTDRVDGDAYNRVLGADLRALWRKIWFSQAQLVGSWTRDGGGARAGMLWDATVYDRTGRAYGNHLEFRGVSPDFTAASGFVPRTNYVQATLYNRFSWYGHPGDFLEQVSTFVGYTPLWRYDDFLHARSTIEGGFTDTWTVNARGGWGVTVNLSDVEQVFDPAAYTQYATDAAGTRFAVPHGLYNLLGGNAGVTTPNRALTVGLFAGYTAVPIFAEAAAGRERDAQVTVTWRPTSALRLYALWTQARITRARDGSRFSLTNIPRLKLEYQASRAIFFRYVGQYFAQDQGALLDPRTGRPLFFTVGPGSAVPAAAQLTNQFRNDFLFSFKPTPGTVCFFGYGTSLTAPAALQFQQLSRTSDGFFLKLSYLFRM
ncbi:MAG TPA: DUF5916 domain-containing protein [Gemmatimonadales bacterium]|jgi:hypothetical protein|nr:DUF5916 domain-containing protein [Gemmatimonadales bacterium]